MENLSTFRIFALEAQCAYALKCLWNEILGGRIIVSYERSFNTEKNAIYRFSISLLIPELRFKATFHSTIFDIPMRPVREDQRHRRRFTC